MAFKDITGHLFGRLYVSSLKEITSREAIWWCWCACGNTSVVGGSSLRRGHTTSCGCLGRERRADSLRCKYEAMRESGEIRKCKHGDSRVGAKHRYLYGSWSSHINSISSSSPSKRCYQGMPVEADWQNNYPVFRDYVLTTLGERPSSAHTLDIIDHDAGFVCGNLRWATKSEQCRNQRRFFTLTPKILLNRLIQLSRGTVS